MKISELEKQIQEKARKEVAAIIEKELTTLKSIWRDSNNIINTEEMIAVIDIVKEQKVKKRPFILYDEDVPKIPIERAAKIITRSIMSQFSRQSDKKK